LFIGLGMSGVSAVEARAQQVQVSPANRTIAITTTETAERRADVATLQVGYHLYGPDSAGVYAQAAQVSQAVAAALEKQGVAKDAIESEGQGTGESRDVHGPEVTAEQRAQRRYEAQQSWSVKTTPAAVSGILAAAVAAGANESGQITWAVADEASLTAEAGTKALGRARDIASQMASGLGARIGSLMYASNQVEAIRPRAEFRGGLVGVEQGAGGGMVGGIYRQPMLKLSAPMITRSATVTAIFGIQ
jgi:uncharacterized protein YggE